MTIVLTNDDGIDAPGIRALSQAIALPCVIVAPKEHLSGCGHQITTQQSIHLEKRSPQEYAVGGTPADCTRLALTHLAPEVKWVLSGINEGGNLGVDVYISGTVAAVREAAIHGIPGIAISHRIKRSLPLDWEQAARFTAKTLALLWEKPLPVGSFWNVNLPHLEPNTQEPEIIFCPLSKSPLPVKYRVDGDTYHYYGEYAQRDRSVGTDVDVCFSGNISVSLITL